MINVYLCSVLEKYPPLTLGNKTSAILYVLFPKCTSLFPLCETLQLFELALLISRHLNIVLIYMYIHPEIQYFIASFRNLYFERISRIVSGEKNLVNPLSRFLVNILLISYISCAHYVCTNIHTICLNHLTVVCRCLSLFINTLMCIS